MQNIPNLAIIFSNCSKADQVIRKTAESDLKKLSESPQYPIFLAQYLLNEKTPDLALRSSIELKKWCEDYKKLEGYEALCRKDAVEDLKANIFTLLLNTDNKVGIQISEAIYFLSTKEFPEKWPVLTKNLASYLNLNNNLDKQYLVMKTLLKIFKKYEYSERSDPLYEEIILVANECHDIFLNFTSTLLQNLNEKNLGLLKISLKIFYCLNFQDLHPNYENNLNTWMNLIAQVLRLDSKLFRDDILILKCKGEAMRCILLYVTKYRDEFESLIQNFSQEIWNICLNTSDDNKYDKIVLNALKYFKNLILWPSLNAYFKQNISTLINSLIIPNLKVSKNDQYLFKEEPDNFVDIFFNNNSEITSRKSVTIELLKNLSRYYKEDLNQIFQNSMLQYIDSIKTGQKNLEMETTLINLFCDGVSIAFRPKDGVTEVSIQQEFFQFVFGNLFSNYIVQIYNDIMSQSMNYVEEKYNVLHLTFICRFLFYFRNFLDKKTLLELAKVISYFSKTKSEALLSVIYYTVESFLDIKEGNFKSLVVLPNYFTKDNLMPQIAEILQNFYNSGKSNPTLNNYLLRVFLMIIKSLKGECANFLPAFVDFYSETLQKMTKGYTYQSALYIFEALAIFIQSSCQGNKNSENMIESTIIPILNDFFNKNLSDLFSFVMQIYSIVIQTFSIDNIKETYLIVFNSILDQKNWLLDNSSIFPAYCIYLDSFYKKFPQKIFETQDALKNIMLTLLSNNLENLYFNLSYSLINILSFSDLKNSNWLGFIYSNLFNYYGKIKQINQTAELSTKTKNTPSRPLFIKDMFVFVCYCFIKFDAVELISNLEYISPNALSSFLISELIVLKNIQRKGPERRTIFYGTSNLLFIGFFGNSIALDVWAQVLSSLVENIINRKNIRVRGRVEFVAGAVSGINSESGFQKLSAIRDIKEDLNSSEDEEKIFALKFHEFINNPQVKNAINVGNILSIQQQETIMKILQG